MSRYSVGDSVESGAVLASIRSPEILPVQNEWIAAVTALESARFEQGKDDTLFATAPDGDARLFVVEKGGLIRILQNGSILPTPFLDLSAAVDIAGERGLLGMAFDPNFATNRRL